MAGVAGWSFIILFVSAGVLTFPGASTVRGVLVPSLLPVFGVHFSILLTGVLYAFAYWFKSRRAALLITGLFILGAAMGWLARSWDIWGGFEKLGITYTRQIPCSGACLAALGLGITLVRGRLRLTPRASG